MAEQTPNPAVDRSEQVDSERLERSTTLGSRRIFRRFVLLVLGIDLAIGVGMVIYDVSDTIDTTEFLLETSSERLVEVCRRLRRLRPEKKPAQVVAEAAALTGVPIALLSKQGQVHVAGDGKRAPSQVATRITQALPRIFADRRPAVGTWIEIREDLAELSGAWSFTPYNDKLLLLVVVPRLPEQEGLLRYMTIGAAVMGFGLMIALLFMVVSANWVLHQPLRGLIKQLTGELARDNQRRAVAENEANRARYEAEQHLAFRDQLIDASGWIGIVATGPDAVIQVFNRGAHRLLGFSEKDTAGMTLPQLREQLRRPAETPLPLRELIQLTEGEEFAVDKAGTEILLQTNLSDINDNEGNTIGQLLLFFDTTRRKQLEAELALNEMQLVQASKMASLGEMATGIAHELNQPLNNISLLTSRMGRRVRQLSDEDASFSREKLSKIEGQVQRASKIIDQLRTFGRPRSREVTIVNLHHPVHNVIDLLRQQFKERGIEIEVDVPDALPPVRIDEGQLEQVLINLVNNARDALEDLSPIDSAPGPRVTIHGREGWLSGKRAVELVVTDNGPGMPEEIASRIFEPFYTTKEVGKGTGLGLSISYSLVRGFGGKLEVLSNSGGSSFIITLPADEPTSEEA